MLNDKIALVTGAGRGIGRAIALSLAGQGAVVVVNYSGSEQAAGEVAGKIMENGGTAMTYRCNVADFQQVEKMIRAVVEKYGRLDILVNNAGITRDGLIMKMSEEDFDQVMDINLKGTFNTIRHCARQMIKQRAGSIINISSVSGVLGNTGQANYAASKAGVIGLTKTMARELASRGIRVNAVAPGFIQTDMTESLSDTLKEQVKAQIPLGRMGNPEEIAGVVSFLASDQAGYMTGQIIHVDGGMAI